MIAKLKGLIDSVGDDWLIIDVGGVGYLVFCSGRTLSAIAGVGEEASLFIETHVREDHIHLFGFATKREHEWFLLLQSVQGVGAKVALAILSVLTPDALSNAIAAKDAKSVTHANGVGPKLAQRIVNELKDKVAKFTFSIAPVQAASAAPIALPGDDALVEDAISALTNLGYGRAEAFSAVAAAKHQMGESADLSGLIRAGLKELSA